MLFHAVAILGALQTPSLEKAVEALHKNVAGARSLDLTITLKGKGEPVVWKVRALRPNFVWMASKVQAYINDGQSAWMYYPDRKEYNPWPERLRGLLLAPGFESFLPNDIRKPKYDRIEATGFEGRPALALLQDTKGIPNLSVRLLLDPNSFWPLGQEQTFNGSTTTSVYSDLRTDAELSPKDFVWTPPVDAKDTSQEKREWVWMKVGDQAPDFTAKTLDGKTVSLASLLKKNKAVVLNFWFTTCGYCLYEMPEMDRLHRRLKEVAFVGVNDIDPVEEQKRFMRKPAFGYPTLLDPMKAIARGYKAAGNGYPITYVVAPDGKIAYVQPGYDTERKLQDLEQALAKLLR
ncbi:redoxin domain-containing protein [bacterium]|nr:MAG: redoxin domain-containing protein [bacterium]